MSHLLLSIIDNGLRGAETGHYLIMLVVAIGLLKSIASTGQPSTNRLCGASMVTLLATVLSVQASTIFDLASYLSESAASALPILAAIAVAVAIGLGCIGLFARQRTDPPQQGFTMASAAVLLSICYATLLVGVFDTASGVTLTPGSMSVVAASSAPAQMPAREATISEPTQQAALAGPGHERLIAYHESPGTEKPSHQSLAGEEPLPASSYREHDYAFEDLNFTYDCPGPEWERQHITCDEPSTTLLALTNRRETWAIAATPLPSWVPAKLLASAAASKILSTIPQTVIGPTRPLTVAGISGLLFEATSADRYQQHASRVWVGSANGVAYQLTAMSPSLGAQELASKFDQLANGFRLIKPATAPPSNVGSFFEPEKFGFTMPLKKDQWMEAPAMRQHVAPFLSYAAMNPLNEDKAAVLSLPLGDEDVDLDLAAQTLLAAMHLDVHSEEVTETHRTNDDRSIDYRADRHVDGQSFDYRLRVMKTDGCAHLVVAWGNRWRLSLDKDLVAVLDAFALTDSPIDLTGVGDSASKRKMADTVNLLALLEFQSGEFRTSLARLELANELDPKNALYAENIVAASREAEGPKAALTRLESFGELLDGQPETALLRAELLFETQRFDEALDAYAAAATASPLGEEALLVMGNAAVMAGRYEEVLAAVQRTLKRKATPKLRRWHATLLSRAGRHDESIRELIQLVVANPNDESLVYAMIEAYEEAEQLEKAIELCQKAITDFPVMADFWSMLGRLQIQTKDYDAAKQSLEHSLEMSPGDSESSELLAVVSGLLGRGENRHIREPIEAIATPPAVLAAMREARPVTTAAQTDGLIKLQSSVGYSFTPGQPRRVTEHNRIRILDRRGVDRVALMDRSFNPLSERMYVNELVVHDQNGVEIGRGSVSDYYVMDDNDSGMDTYDQVLKIPVPGAQPGCTISLTITRESLSSRSEFGYESHFLTSSDPIAASAVFFVGDTSKIDYRSSHSQLLKPDSQTLAWVAINPEQAIHESHQRDPEHYLPMVRLNDTERSWKELGDEHLRELAPVLKPSDSIEQLAQRLCRGKADESQRIEAVAGYVQSAISYRALEFGIRGIIPHPVEEICRVASGDCKDQALLLHHLLRGAGVRSHLALVNASGPVDPELPSLDQFDHMIVCVPNLPTRGGVSQPMGMIDPTQKSTDPLLGIPLGLSKSKVLVLADTGSSLVTTSGLDESQSWINCLRTASITSQSDLGPAALRVSETVTLGPQLSSLFRQSFEGTTEKDQRKALRSMIGESRTVRVDAVELASVEELDKPLIIKCHYQIIDAFHEVAGDRKLLVGTMPNHWASLYCNPDPIDQRETPFEFRTPVAFRSATRLIPPTGYRVATTEGLTHQAAQASFAWKTEAHAIEGGGVDVNLAIRRPSGVYPADHYSQFETTASRALRVASKAITIERVQSTQR